MALQRRKEKKKKDVSIMPEKLQLIVNSAKPDHWWMD